MEENQVIVLIVFSISRQSKCSSNKNRFHIWAPFVSKIVCRKLLSHPMNCISIRFLFWFRGKGVHLLIFGGGGGVNSWETWKQKRPKIYFCMIFCDLGEVPRTHIEKREEGGGATGHSPIKGCLILSLSPNKSGRGGLLTIFRTDCLLKMQ